MIAIYGREAKRIIYHKVCQLMRELVVLHFHHKKSRFKLRFIFEICLVFTQSRMFSSYCHGNQNVDRLSNPTDTSNFLS